MWRTQIAGMYVPCEYNTEIDLDEINIRYLNVAEADIIKPQHLHIHHIMSMVGCTLPIYHIHDTTGLKYHLGWYILRSVRKIDQDVSEINLKQVNIPPTDLHEKTETKKSIQAKIIDYIKYKLK
jgi:hypothetical protein